MHTVEVIIFLLTYLGVALGRVPGLALDRTGIALLGGIAMVVSGALSLEGALDAIDMPTLLLLYALMVVSAQLRLGGFYTFCALKSTRWLHRPRLFLASIMALSAVLSALLANDIVCLAFTPVLVLSLKRSGRVPLPYLLGLAIASNIGSAATIIGNPQNMLIGQVGRLSFGAFTAWCLPPALLALVLSYVFLLWQHREALETLLPSQGDPHQGRQGPWPEFNRWQSGKGVLATLTLAVLFLGPWPRELVAIGIAGVLLCSRRMKSKQMLELVDWHLMTLFGGLFIVIRGLELSGAPVASMTWLSAHGVAVTNLPMLAMASTILSNLVSNVPAVMLFLQFLDPTKLEQWYVLAVSSTFAGNLVVIGSIANLIVIEQARQYGVEIGFYTHARSGIPVTILSLVVLWGWLLL